VQRRTAVKLVDSKQRLNADRKSSSPSVDMLETIVSFGALLGFLFHTGTLPECSIMTPMQHDLALYADLKGKKREQR
jgi:hypothetical protein